MSQPQQSATAPRAFNPQQQQQQQQQHHSPSPTIPNQQVSYPNLQKPPPSRMSPTTASHFSQSFPGASPGAGVATPGTSTPNGLPSPSLPAHNSPHYPQANYNQLPQTNGRSTPTMGHTPHPPPPSHQTPQHHQGQPMGQAQNRTIGLAANHPAHASPNNTHPINTSVSQGNMGSPAAAMSPTQQPGTPGAMQNAQNSYTNATFTAATTPMGPPPATPYTNDAARQAPVIKQAPAKAFAYDMDDTLAGTGINLDEEEQFMNDFEQRVGFGAFAPGGRGTFYGAGPANQPAEKSKSRTQEELAAESADLSWNQAAHNMALSRLHDWKQEGFVQPAMLHWQLETIAKRNNLELNMDPKPTKEHMPLGRFTQPANLPKPTVTVKQTPTPDGTMVETIGSIIPKDASLIDQIALLSLAVKERMGELISEADSIACLRQQTAHGAVPPEWADAALSPLMAQSNSAVSPGTKSLKRPADEMSNGLPTPVSEASPTNPLVDAVVASGKIVRTAEEARLRKRQKRMDAAENKDKKDDGTSSRSGSVAPGTPGAAAPEAADSKPLTKKESKKVASKLAEATSSTVNSTLSQFMGGKKKKYSWMTGGAASGASTPRAGGMSAAPAGGSRGAAKGPLTQGSAHHLGQFREDSAKGKNIQLRDWVHVLEQQRTEQKALQEAYNRMDRSDAGDKAIVPAAPAAATATATAAAATPTPTPRKTEQTTS
ncbi:Transcription initiation factor TFIID component TAF4 [Apiospora arundinis]|uniref:TBP-associated factor 4 n=1 Tax=Apiospora arundinis TaxID=335852 RepID=A0ABR2IET3_9PEZI